jgi:hypothetical protein
MHASRSTLSNVSQKEIKKSPNEAVASFSMKRKQSKVWWTLFSGWGGGVLGKLVTLSGLLAVVVLSKVLKQTCISTPKGRFGSTA